MTEVELQDVLTWDWGEPRAAERYLFEIERRRVNARALADRAERLREIGRRPPVLAAYARLAPRPSRALATLQREVEKLLDALDAA